MLWNLLYATLAAAAMIVVTGSFQTASAQYYYGSGSPYGPYAPRTFDDYVDERVRQLRIQRATGAPYYPFLDRGNFYDRQRVRSYIYRPNYEGRQFRYNRPAYSDYYRDRYDYNPYRGRSRDLNDYRYGYDRW